MGLELLVLMDPPCRHRIQPKGGYRRRAPRRVNVSVDAAIQVAAPPA